MLGLDWFHSCGIRYATVGRGLTLGLSDSTRRRLGVNVTGLDFNAHAFFDTGDSETATDL